MNGYFQKVFRSLGNEMQNRNTYSFFDQIIVAIFYYVDNSPSTTPTPLETILGFYWEKYCTHIFTLNVRAIFWWMSLFFLLNDTFCWNWNLANCNKKICKNYGDCRGSWILILCCFICSFVENDRVQMSQM